MESFESGWLLKKPVKREIKHKTKHKIVENTQGSRTVALKKSRFSKKKLGF